MTLSKNKIKYINSLRIKKFRQKYNNFIAEGDKIAREIILQQNVEIEAIYATASWIDTYESQLSVGRDKVFNISITELKGISTLKTANEVLIIAKQPSFKLSPEILKKQLILYLDAIQDPGNMGTILRIADWFGIPAVYCSEECADLYNPKVVQASMGAFLRVSVNTSSLETIKSKLEIPVLGATLQGENVYKMDLPEAGIIVIGNESKGIRPSNLELLTHQIKIPSFGDGGAESLNAGVATGIICSQFRGKG